MPATRGRWISPTYESGSFTLVLPRHNRRATAPDPAAREREVEAVER